MIHTSPTLVWKRRRRCKQARIRWPLHLRVAQYFDVGVSGGEGSSMTGRSDTRIRLASLCSPYERGLVESRHLGKREPQKQELTKHRAGCNGLS